MWNKQLFFLLLAVARRCCTPMWPPEGTWRHLGEDDVSRSPFLSRCRWLAHWKNEPWTSPLSSFTCPTLKLSSFPAVCVVSWVCAEVKDHCLLCHSAIVKMTLYFMESGSWARRRNFPNCFLHSWRRMTCCDWRPYHGDPEEVFYVLAEFFGVF